MSSTSLPARRFEFSPSLTTDDGPGTGPADHMACNGSPPHRRAKRGWCRPLLGGIPSLATTSSHLVAQFNHPALVGLDFREMEGDVSVQSLEERNPVTDQDRQDRVGHLVG